MTTEKTPIEIANIVFSSPPAESKVYQLYCDDDDANVLDIFEIFMTIMMEGILIRCGGTITRDIFYAFDENTLNSLQPWLQSMGYKIHVDAIPYSNVKDYEQFYCQIALKEDPKWKLFFEMNEKRIDKNYHFIFGDKSPYSRNEELTLQNLFAIITKRDSVFKVSFSFV
jgi:hypothetical protein